MIQQTRFKYPSESRPLHPITLQTSKARFWNIDLIAVFMHCHLVKWPITTIKEPILGAITRTNYCPINIQFWPMLLAELKWRCEAITQTDQSCRVTADKHHNRTFPLVTIVLLNHMYTKMMVGIFKKNTVHINRVDIIYST